MNTTGKLGEMSSLILAIKGPVGFLGVVSPPDKMLRNNNSTDQIWWWQQVIQGLWEEWQQEKPHSDIDFEFIDWLCEKYGFSNQCSVFVTVC